MNSASIGLLIVDMQWSPSLIPFAQAVSYEQERGYGPSAHWKIWCADLPWHSYQSTHVLSVLYPIMDSRYKMTRLVGRSHPHFVFQYANGFPAGTCRNHSHHSTTETHLPTKELSKDVYLGKLLSWFNSAEIACLERSKKRKLLHSGEDSELRCHKSRCRM